MQSKANDLSVILDPRKDVDEQKEKWYYAVKAVCFIRLREKWGSGKDTLANFRFAKPELEKGAHVHVALRCGANAGILEPKDWQECVDEAVAATKAAGSKQVYDVVVLKANEEVKDWEQYTKAGQNVLQLYGEFSVGKIWSKC